MPPQANSDYAEYKLPTFLELDGELEGTVNYIDKLHKEIINSYEQPEAGHRSVVSIGKSASADGLSQEIARDIAYSYEMVTLTLGEMGKNLEAMRKYAKAVNASPMHQAEIHELTPRRRSYEPRSEEAA